MDKLEALSDTRVQWLPALRKPVFFIYRLILLLVCLLFLSLFLISVSISVGAPGIVRPAAERTDIRSPVSGMIDSIFSTDGQRMETNSLLITIHNPGLRQKLEFVQSEIALRDVLIHDLDILTSKTGFSITEAAALHHALFQQQAQKYLLAVHETTLEFEHAQHDRLLNQQLFSEQIISSKEFYEVCYREAKAAAALEIIRRQQVMEWQAVLLQYAQERRDNLVKRQELESALENYRIRIPASGYIQEMNAHYAGLPVQAGELICTLSPDGQVVAECYVSTKDIGMIAIGQPVNFQVDAFDYSYFGFITGVVSGIDNDFSVVDKQPVFKVKCRLGNQAFVRNGFQGRLKKGMRLQARFMVGRRSLWQLLCGTMDDWLNPSRNSRI